MSEPHRYGARTASLLVVASMVGTGVFTTSGILLEQIGSIPLVLAVWVVGGLVATAGALSYAELATYAPASGGEYALLSRAFHPAVGFVAGMISIVAGFAAPIAACAIAFARYLDAALPGTIPAMPASIAIVVAASVLHALHLRVGARAQDLATIVKVVLIVLFLAGGALLAEPARWIEPIEPRALVSPSFAVGLVFVYFAYTGWNAAAYVAGEIDRPKVTLPRALAIGTLAVMALYVALNAVFFASAPRAELVGVVEIGHVSAVHLFGPSAGRVLSAIIALGLVSTIGALVVTGARVYTAIGRDHPQLALLAWTHAGGAPHVALAIQAALAIAMVVTASFDFLLGAVGFTLSIASGLTVIGLFLERWRHPARDLPYRVPGYPLTPLFFVAVMLWTVAQSILSQPEIALAGGGVIALGALGYAVLALKNRAKLR